MKYIKSFNENNDVKIMSNEAIERIMGELNVISSVLDKDIIKCNAISKDMTNYTSKSNDKNTNIDDAFVSLHTLKDKLKEANNLIMDINEKLLEYTKEGEKYLY
jgi:uncharacterized protein YaaN involved in tellurite resistance